MTRPAERLKSLIDSAFEALGSPLRAAVDGNDVSVHGLVIAHENGNLEIFDIHSENPIFSTEDINTTLAASVACLHIVKKIIANALEPND